MKLFISADIEGVVGITTWSEADKTSPDYPKFALQMTKEVAAVCEGAHEAGFSEVYVKDAHATGRNIDHDLLPEYVKLQRGWSQEPELMSTGIDSSFDAAVFVGYHSEATSSGNPLSHTISSRKISHIKLNGKIASEFMLNAYICAYHGVPVVILTGDSALQSQIELVNPKINLAAVKDGIGLSTVSMHPQKAIDMIKEMAKDKLSGNLSEYKFELPKSFEVEVGYNYHVDALDCSFYPGAKLTSSKTICFETTDYYEVLRLLHFVI